MYSQEVGRAGRDGLLSTCLILCTAEDIPVLEGFARGDTVNKAALEVSFLLKCELDNVKAVI